MDTLSLKKCSICSKLLPPEAYYTSSNYSWCKKCHIVRGQKFRITPIGKLTEMKKDAKKRGIGFTLTIEDVKSMWDLPCHYCGNKLHILSLDRIDNSKPYTVGNVVCCCMWCNYTKGTGSLSFFYDQCKKVVENMPNNLRDIGDKKDFGERYKKALYKIS